MQKIFFGAENLFSSNLPGNKNGAIRIVPGAVGRPEFRCRKFFSVQNIFFGAENLFCSNFPGNKSSAIRIALRCRNLGSVQDSGAENFFRCKKSFLLKFCGESE